MTTKAMKVGPVARSVAKRAAERMGCAPWHVIETAVTLWGLAVEDGTQEEHAEPLDVLDPVAIRERFALVMSQDFAAGRFTPTARLVAQLLVDPARPDAAPLPHEVGEVSAQVLHKMLLLISQTGRMPKDATEMDADQILELFVRSATSVIFSNMKKPQRKRIEA